MVQRITDPEIRLKTSESGTQTGVTTGDFHLCEDRRPRTEITSFTAITSMQRPNYLPTYRSRITLMQMKMPDRMRRNIFVVISRINVVQHFKQ